MNKSIQKLFLILFPFYPLLAWAWHFVTFKPIAFYLNIFLLPLALYYLFNSGKKLPKYLIFFILFVLYHVGSAFSNNTVPAGTNKLFFILFDNNVFACVFFIIIENTYFDKTFIDKMNRNIFYIVILSLIVSIIQIKDPTFFYNDITNGEEIIGMDAEIRNSSIFSWYSINSGGVTFPILISILLNYYDTKKSSFFVIILAGTVVGFLTKARYVMLSMLIVFSQLVISRIKSFSKKVTLIAGFTGVIFLLVFIAGQAGYSIEEVISSRILEKGSDMESAKARVVSYEVFLKKFPENPWMGVGPATRADVLDLLGGGIPVIHVGYLSYLYYYGVAGCFFLFTFLIYLLIEGWKAGTKHNYWASFYGLLAFCVANTTFVYFNFAEMGIILSVIYLRYYKTGIYEEDSEEDTIISES